MGPFLHDFFICGVFRATRMIPMRELYKKKKSIWLELLWFFRPVGVGFELLEQILVSLTAVVANLFQFFFFMFFFSL